MKKIKTKIKKSVFGQAGRIRLSFKSSAFFVYGLIALTAVYYIIGVNDLSAKGYQLYELKVRVSGLTEESTALELEKISLSSIQALNERASNIGLVKADNIEYLAVKNDTVARAEESGGP